MDYDFAVPDVSVAVRFRAVAIFADDLKEWRCQFNAAQDALSRAPSRIVERLFQILGDMGGETPEINFAITHETANALTASGKARRAGGVIPFVLIVTRAP